MTCAPRSPDGAPCTDSSTCQSYICSNGKCGFGNLALSLLCGG
jgi:hypothetical protein